MSKRNMWLTVRLTAEERQQLEEAARRQGYNGVTQFVRASLSRSGMHAQMIEALDGAEKRQAATLATIRNEIRRLQRVEYVVFAMLENLAKTILTYMPQAAAESKAAAIALARAGYERYLKAVGMSLHNGSRAAVEKLAALDDREVSEDNNTWQ